MKLYGRDFNFITDEERLVWEELKEQEKVDINGRVGGTLRRSLYTKYPLAIRHFLSLFPNNFLDSLELQTQTNSLRNKLLEFILLLDNSTITEQEIINFIKAREAYFLIGSILKNYRFGHHASFIFPEFMLTI